MRKSAPIEVVVHYPKTKEGWDELGKRVATAHANYVIEPAHIPAGVIDDPRNVARAIKRSGRRTPLICLIITSIDIYKVVHAVNIPPIAATLYL